MELLRFSLQGFAFAALKGNGPVVTWGDSDYGGSSTGVATHLSSGVTKIFSTDEGLCGPEECNGQRRDLGGWRLWRNFH